ncbi:MAG: hypothetical protein ACLUOS_03195 [Odoribacter splanchnicus]
MKYLYTIVMAMLVLASCSKTNVWCIRTRLAFISGLCSGGR